MAIILETPRFIYASHDQPHHHRENGGHSKISPKDHYTSLDDMPEQLLIPMMRLVRLAGQAVITVMRKKDIPVVRINYQENGNWGYFPQVNRPPHVHIHLYVRSENEKHPNNDPRFRPFPQALFFPFIEEDPDYYASFKPYTEEDCWDIRAELDRLLNLRLYADLREQL